MGGHSSWKKNIFGHESLEQWGDIMSWNGGRWKVLLQLLQLTNGWHLSTPTRD